MVGASHGRSVGITCYSGAFALDLVQIDDWGNAASELRLEKLILNAAEPLLSFLLHSYLPKVVRLNCLLIFVVFVSVR